MYVSNNNQIRSIKKIAKLTRWAHYYTPFLWTDTECSKDGFGKNNSPCGSCGLVFEHGLLWVNIFLVNLTEYDKTRDQKSRYFRQENDEFFHIFVFFIEIHLLTSSRCHLEERKLRISDSKISSDLVNKSELWLRGLSNSKVLIIYTVPQWFCPMLKVSEKYFIL